MTGGSDGAVDADAVASEKADAPVERHARLLHHKTLELVLGAMVAQDGIDKTRRILEWYLSQLEDY